MEQKHEHHERTSYLTYAFSRFVKWGNNWLTLSHWLFKEGAHIFRKIEIMMLIITAICIGLLFSIHILPHWLGLTISIILVQRIVEFAIVYARNFIHNKGRIFTHFENPTRRGEWLLLMFMFNITQIVFIFALWYRFISLNNPNAFSVPLGILDSLYFSAVTFLTIGFGDIVPLGTMPKLLVLFQGMLTFYILVVVINGLISIHFNRRYE